MVRVNAPMMSLDASGSIGGAITYSKWKGRNYARQLVIPSNPKSGLQVGMRSMLKFLSQDWTNLSAPEVATWETLAAQKIVSTFNAFVSRNQARWRSFKAPSKSDPALGTGTDSVFSGWAATGGVREVLLDLTVDTLNDGWGVAIFRNDSGTFTESLSNCIAVIQTNAAAAFQFVDSPLVAGTYYYSYIPFTEAGKKGTPSAEVNGTCT
jgi:hypothetical protein